MTFGPLTWAVICFLHSHLPGWMETIFFLFKSQGSFNSSEKVTRSRWKPASPVDQKKEHEFWLRFSNFRTSIGSTEKRGHCRILEHSRKWSPTRYFSNSTFIKLENIERFSDTEFYSEVPQEALLSYTSKPTIISWTAGIYNSIIQIRSSQVSRRSINEETKLFQRSRNPGSKSSSPRETRFL